MEDFEKTELIEQGKALIEIYKQATGKIENLDNLNQSQKERSHELFNDLVIIFKKILDKLEGTNDKEPLRTDQES